MADKPLRVLLIDDDPRIHEAVALTLDDCDDIVLAATALDGQAGYDLYRGHSFDVVLMDVMMPRMDGLTATRQILADDPAARILVLSNYHDIQHVRALLEAGAIGYTLKISLHNRLVDAIRAAHSGSTVMAPEISQKLLEITTPKGEERNDYGLTDREREVLHHMADGLNNKEIASKLFISRSTVKFHIANVIEKMAVETRAEAIVLAVRNHLV